MIASDALQVAVYGALNGNISAAVYDHVPPNAQAPYVVLGETTMVPWDTHDSDGSEETITLHIWDDAKGTRRMKQVMQQVDTLLHHQSLQLDGAGLVMLRQDFITTFRDAVSPDEVWRHGVLRYRALISDQQES